MDNSVIKKAWYDYCNSVLNPDIDPENNAWTVVFAESDSQNPAPRPPKPYVSLKIISGPNKIAIDDNFRYDESDETHHMVGQRGYTISIKSFGPGFIEGLHDIETCLRDPDKRDQLSADADIAMQSTTGVSDISAKLETGFESRATLDIIFNSSNNKITNIGPIESVEVEGTMTNADGSKDVNTNMPIITEE